MALFHREESSLTSPLSPAAPLWFGFITMMLSWLLWNGIRIAYKPSKAVPIICILSVMAVTTLAYLIQLTLPHPRPLLQIINALITAPLLTASFVVYADRICADGYAAISSATLTITAQLAASNLRNEYSRLSFDLVTCVFFTAFCCSVQRVTKLLAAQSALTYAVLYLTLPSMLIGYVATNAILAIFYQTELISFASFISVSALIDVTFKLIFSSLLTAQIVSNEATNSFVVVTAETQSVYDEPTVFYGQSPDDAPYQKYRRSKLSSYQTDVVDERVAHVTRQYDEDEDQTFEPL